MSNKIFYLKRDENDETITSLERADKPQFLPIVSLDENGNPNVDNPIENQIYATEEAKQDILLTMDKVVSGDLNPVTSNAVANAVEEIKQYIRDQEYLADPVSISSGTVMEYDGWITINNYRANSNEWFVSTPALTFAAKGGAYGMSGANITFFLRKGETFSGRIEVFNIASVTSGTVRYYTKRDYTDR